MLELSQHEINVILHALARQPYEDVAHIIQHIMEQVDKDTTA